jgi:hypothetical protein
LFSSDEEWLVFANEQGEIKKAQINPFSIDNMGTEEEEVNHLAIRDKQLVTASINGRLTVRNWETKEVLICLKREIQVTTLFIMENNLWFGGFTGEFFQADLNSINDLNL